MHTYDVHIKNGEVIDGTARQNLSLTLLLIMVK